MSQVNKGQTTTTKYEQKTNKQTNKQTKMKVAEKCNQRENNLRCDNYKQNTERRAGNDWRGQHEHDARITVTKPKHHETT